MINRFNSRACVALVVAGLLAAAEGADAQVNPGFESTPLPGGTYGVFTNGSDIGGWTVIGKTVALHTTYAEAGAGIGGSTLTFNSHSGMVALDMTGQGNEGLNIGVEQWIPTAAGLSYDVKFWIGTAFGNSPYITPSTVDLSIDGGSRISFTNPNFTPNSINWMQFSYSFVATDAATLVTFFNGTSAPNAMAGLDDVDVELSSTPEPATLIMLASGLLAIGGVARRRPR